MKAKWILILLSLVVLLSTCINSEKKENEVLDFKVTERISKNNLFAGFDAILYNVDSTKISIELFRNTYNYFLDNNESSFEKTQFFQLLNEYSVKIVIDSSKKDFNNYLLIQQLIKKELDLNPFEKLSENQKNLLMRLNKAIDMRDSNSSKMILKEDVQNLLLRQNDEISTLQGWNKFWTILGILLSLFFGLTQLLYPSGTKRVLSKLFNTKDQVNLIKESDK